MKPLTMSEEKEQVDRDQAARAVMVGVPLLRRAYAEVDALRAKLAERMLVAGQVADDWNATRLALAASQAEVRELRERAGNVVESHYSGDSSALLSVNIDCLSAALARPTSDTALRGLLRRVGVQVWIAARGPWEKRHRSTDIATIVNEVLGEASPRPDGPGAEPISAGEGA